MRASTRFVGKKFASCVGLQESRKETKQMSTIRYDGGFLLYFCSLFFLFYSFFAARYTVWLLFYIKKLWTECYHAFIFRCYPTLLWSSFCSVFHDLSISPVFPFHILIKPHFYSSLHPAFLIFVIIITHTPFRLFSLSPMPPHHPSTPSLSPSF